MAAGAAMRSAPFLNPWAGHGYYSLDISLLLLHQHFDELSENFRMASLTTARPRSFVFLNYSYYFIHEFAFQEMTFKPWKLMVTKHVEWTKLLWVSGC